MPDCRRSIPPFFFFSRRRSEICGPPLRRPSCPGEGVKLSSTDADPNEFESGCRPFRQMPLVSVVPESWAPGPRPSLRIFADQNRSKVRCRAAPVRPAGVGGSMPVGDAHPALVLVKFSTRCLRDRPTATPRCARIAARLPQPSPIASKSGRHEALYYAALNPVADRPAPIGGNVAEESGVVHCPEYGHPPPTTFCAIEMVLIRPSTVVRLRSRKHPPTSEGPYEPDWA